MRIAVRLAVLATFILVVGGGVLAGVYAGRQRSARPDVSVAVPVPTLRPQPTTDQQIADLQARIARSPANAQSYTSLAEGAHRLDVPLLHPDIQTLFPSEDKSVVSLADRADFLEVAVFSGGESRAALDDGTVLSQSAPLSSYRPDWPRTPAGALPRRGSDGLPHPGPLGLPCTLGLRTQCRLHRQ